RRNEAQVAGIFHDQYLRARGWHATLVHGELELLLLVLVQVQAAIVGLGSIAATLLGEHGLALYLDSEQAVLQLLEQRWRGGEWDVDDASARLVGRLLVLLVADLSNGREGAVCLHAESERAEIDLREVRGGTARDGVFRDGTV